MTCLLVVAFSSFKYLEEQWGWGGGCGAGYCLGDGHPVSGPDVCLAHSLMSSLCPWGRGGSPVWHWHRLEVVAVAAMRIQPTSAEGFAKHKTLVRGSWEWEMGLSRVRPQPASHCQPVSQLLLQARASSPPPSCHCPQDTVFLLDLLLDLMAARADILPQPFCLASEILFLLQGTFGFLFF